MKKHEVQPGQSLFDIAVIRYGNVGGIHFLLADNPGLNGPTDRILAGQNLVIREQTINARTKLYLEDHPVIATIGPEDMPEGIGYWALEEYQVQGISGYVPPVEPEADLEFIEGSVYVVDIGSKYIHLAINKVGSYTFFFRNMATGEIAYFFDAEFLVPNSPVQFGEFPPGNYRIEVNGVYTLITVS